LPTSGPRFIHMTLVLPSIQFCTSSEYHLTMQHHLFLLQTCRVDLVSLWTVDYFHFHSSFVQNLMTHAQMSSYASFQCCRGRPILIPHPLRSFNLSPYPLKYPSTPSCPSDRSPEVQPHKPPWSPQLLLAQYASSLHTPQAQYPSPSEVGFSTSHTERVSRVQLPPSSHHSFSCSPISAHCAT
jgi:hypothetical protein